MSTDRTCGCGCGASLAGLRADALYHNEACKKRAERARRRDKAGTGCGSRGGNVRSVEEAQILHRQHKERWTRRIRVRMAETLLATDYFHADDLANLEIPDEHSSIIGSQVSLFQRAGWMAYAGRRASQRPAANHRKSNVYRVTDDGRPELRALIAGAGSENPEGSARNNETALAPSTGRPSTVAGSSLAAGSGEAPSGGAPEKAPSLPLPEGAARLFDLGEAA